MKVILNERVAHLGYQWDIAEVKPGYARNYLFPKGLASLATPALMKKAEVFIQDRVKKLEEAKANAKETVQKLAEITLVFKRKAKGKKLFGSVTEKDIVDVLLKDHKLELTKDMVKMDEHLKAVGDHKVKIHLVEGVDATVNVKVEAEEGAEKKEKAEKKTAKK